MRLLHRIAVYLLLWVFLGILGFATFGWMLANPNTAESGDVLGDFLGPILWIGGVFLAGLVMVVWNALDSDD